MSVRSKKKKVLLFFFVKLICLILVNFQVDLLGFSDPFPISAPSEQKKSAAKTVSYSGLLEHLSTPRTRGTEKVKAARHIGRDLQGNKKIVTCNAADSIRLNALFFSMREYPAWASIPGKLCT